MSMPNSSPFALFQDEVNEIQRRRGRSRHTPRMMVRGPPNTMGDPMRMYISLLLQAVTFLKNVVWITVIAMLVIITVTVTTALRMYSP